MSAVWGWSKVECTPDGGAPCQRSLHAAAVLNDSIYIFGGVRLRKRCLTFFFFSSVHIYDIETQNVIFLSSPFHGFPRPRLLHRIARARPRPKL